MGSLTHWGPGHLEGVLRDMAKEPDSTCYRDADTI